VTARIHPTAIIEAGVHIGAGTAVWDNVHIRERTRIGDACIIGEKAHIAYDVHIGDRVKIGAFAHVCTGVTIEDGVMIAIGTVFTNERYPRAATPDLQHLLPSTPTDRTLATVVRRGATVGAGALIGPGVEIGAFAMVGMGAVVSRSVAPFHLVAGNPARPLAAVCRCGDPLHRFGTDGVEGTTLTGVPCARCGRGYDIVRGVVRERASE
jgi:acetyltransferase-like isoleucine patch superfamily enzyme